jgi:DNA-binding transcriptional MerR regulator
MESKVENEAMPPTTDGSKKLYVHWNDSIFSLYGSYFIDEKLLPHRQRINERNKPLANTGLSYRVINHWEKTGLIDVDRGEEGTGWRKYSAMDAIWINLIIELRKFGVSIENINKIKEQLTAGNEEYKPSVYPLLEFYSSLFMQHKEETYILVPDNFEIDIATQSQIEISKMLNGICNHISISLHDIIKTVYKKHDLKLKRETKVELNREEVILLSEIRTGAYKSIEVKMKDGRLYQLNKDVILTEIQIQKLLQDKNYGDITFKKENGKVIHAQQIIKQRL